MPVAAAISSLPRNVAITVYWPGVIPGGSTKVTVTKPLMSGVPENWPGIPGMVKVTTPEVTGPLAVTNWAVRVIVCVDALVVIVGLEMSNSWEATGDDSEVSPVVWLVAVAVTTVPRGSVATGACEIDVATRIGGHVFESQKHLALVGGPGQRVGEEFDAERCPGNACQAAGNGIGCQSGDEGRILAIVGIWPWVGAIGRLALVAQRDGRAGIAVNVVAEDGISGRRGIGRAAPDDHAGAAVGDRVAAASGGAADLIDAGAVLDQHAGQDIAKVAGATVVRADLIALHGIAAGPGAGEGNAIVVACHHVACSGRVAAHRVV